MTQDSLPPPPALTGSDAGGGKPWGRSARELAGDDDSVTHASPSVDQTDPRAPRIDPRRVLGPVPEPVLRSRPARASELPKTVTAVVAGAVQPWTTTATYAIGAVPYTWDRRHGGYLLTDSVVLRIAHPDGRRGVGTWVRDAVASRRGVWSLTWAWREGWRWRVPLVSYPQPIGARALKAAVADPTWRADVYRLEDVA